MTNFNTQTGNGEYRLQFETNNRDHFLVMQEVARRCVDGNIVPGVHGEWENNEYGFQCNECRGDSLYDGFNHPVKSRFCPNCGAKMGSRSNVTRKD